MKQRNLRHRMSTPTPKLWDGWLTNSVSCVGAIRRVSSVANRSSWEVRSVATRLRHGHCIRCEAASCLNLDLGQATVAIQGFGNAGSIAAELLHKLCVRVIAVSHSSGAICNPKGLNPADVAEQKRKVGRVLGFPDAKTISAMELLTSQCDILIPAALENVITDKNASHVQAKLIAEAANGPTTPEADEILHEKGVMVNFMGWVCVPPPISSHWSGSSTPCAHVVGFRARSLKKLGGAQP